MVEQGRMNSIKVLSFSCGEAAAVPQKKKNHPNWLGPAMHSGLFSVTVGLSFLSGWLLNVKHKTSAFAGSSHSSKPDGKVISDIKLHWSCSKYLIWYYIIKHCWMQSYKLEKVNTFPACVWMCWLQRSQNKRSHSNSPPPGGTDGAVHIYYYFYPKQSVYWWLLIWYFPTSGFRLTNCKITAHRVTSNWWVTSAVGL